LPSESNKIAFPLQDFENLASSKLSPKIMKVRQSFWNKKSKMITFNLTRAWELSSLVCKMLDSRPTPKRKKGSGMEINQRHVVGRSKVDEV
jgi:hypothetical protein